MKVMKRILSAILCMAMVLSSLSLSAFTAFGEETETKYKVGDVIEFGSYKQSAIKNENNETIGFNVEPIKWRILKIEDGKALLLSSEIIDTGMYNSTSATVDGYYANNYAHSDIRNWLINDFYNTAFSSAEKSSIVATTLDNSACATDVNASGSYTKYSSEATTDKVFLLSKNEADTYASKYFEATATDYAYANGFKPGESTSPSNHWFLRTAGNNTYQIYYVQIRWGVYKTYFNWYDDALQDMKGVRPAFYLDLDAYENYKIPSLDNDSAAAFIGFLTNGVNPQTKDDWKKNEIEATALYQIMTNTYTGEDFDAQAESLILYATAATSAMASKATDNSAFLNKTITEYLEKEAGRHDNLDAEIINEYQNAASKKLTEFFRDTINILLPVSADSIFSVTDLYGYYSTLSGAPAKAQKIAEQVVAAIETGIMITEYEKAGRYTYFSTYLSLRGGYGSKDDPIFRMLMDSNRTIISDANWLANIINLFTWLTNKESFNKNFELMDSWAEYIYQLDCYIKGKAVETNATAVTEESLNYTTSGTNATITSVNTDLNGHVLLPNSVADSTVTKIDSSAFENQTAMESVKLGDSVEVVGSSAFKGCTSLESVAITSNVTTIETSAFENCTSLKQVVIPDGVTSIGDNAFAGCSEDLEIVCNCSNAYVIEYCVSNEISYVAVHDFGEYVSDENGNCDHYGTFTAQCAQCEATDTIIDWSSAGGHVWNGSVTKQPTETEAGEYTLTCENCGEYQVKTIAVLKFSGASLTLHNNLSINYKVDKALFEETGYENPYVIFERNGVKTVVKDYTVEGDRYVFTFRNIAPNQMNDTISATLYATYGGVQYASQTKDYSVVEYCYSMLELYPGEEYAELRTLLVDLLHYGAASQVYTDYNTDNLVNADLTETQLAWGTAGAPTLTTVLDKAYEVVEEPKATWKGAGLNLQDSIAMRFKLTADSIDGLTVKIKSGTDTWTIPTSAFVEEDGAYYVYFRRLHAGQMRQSVYLTVYEGDTPVSNTVCYSIESYAYEMQNSTDTALAALVQAMMRYGDAASAYVNG